MRTHALGYLAGVSLLAIASSASAQAQSGSTSVEEVVVTGSRIVQSGYERPTPVTVVAAEALRQSSPGSLTQGIVNLPAFINSNSPKNSNDSPQRAINGSKAGTYLNLRSLGTVRNLILQDGARVPPATAGGFVDVNIIPELLVQRVDVVTAGVSAVYGSDAVSGVVNFILDHKFTGVKGVAQAGVSAENDGSTWKLGVAGGTAFADGRGHVLVSYEKSGAAGVEKDARKYSADNWFTGPGTPVGTPGTAAAPLRFLSNVGSINAAPNGYLLAGLPGFNALTWTNGGQLRAYDPGRFASANSQIGGDASYFPQNAHNISNPYRDQAFARVSFDLTDKVNAFAEVSATRTTQDSYTNFASVRFGIQADNAFLPPEGAAALAAALARPGVNPANPNPAATTTCGFGAPTIACYVRRIVPERGTPAGQLLQDEQLNNLNYKIGVSGEIFEGWRFDAAYIHGHFKWYSETAGEFQQVKIFASGDSVRHPTTGQPVCRITLTNPTSPIAQGCTPYNWLGPNVNTKALWDYIGGEASWLRVTNTTEDWMANITGSPFSTWAGPVGVAFGVEYRSIKLRQTSNSDPAIPENCAGIRVCNPNSGRFLATNTGLAFGKNNVKEANVEVEVPLAKDMTLAKSFSVTGAYRWTDYSTSGKVQTWKAGGSWEPVEDLRFRLTRSRDIRAPTLLDLFGGTTNNRGVFVDPHCNCQALAGTFVIGGGNKNLKPERANTLTYGVVFKPSFAPRFTASIDYYDIKLTDVINVLSPTQVMQQCEDAGGTGPTCAGIVRPLPFSDRTIANAAISVFAGPVNAALLRTKGLDFEATFRMPVEVWNLEGELTWHLLANNVRTFNYKGFERDNLRRLVGLTGSPPGNSPYFIGDQPVPKWQGSLSATYKQGPVTAFIQGRMIDKLKLGPQVFAEPDLPRVFYTDVTATYDTRIAKRDTQVFVTVNNLFNQQAPLFPGSLVSGLEYPTLIQLYDVMGRYYTAGLRFKF